MKKYKLTLIAAAVAFSCGTVQAEDLGNNQTIETAPESGYNRVVVDSGSTTVKKGDLLVDYSANTVTNKSAVDIKGESTTVNFGTKDSALDSVTIRAHEGNVNPQGERVYWLGYVNNGATLNVYANKYEQRGSEKGLWVENGANANFNVNTFKSTTATTAIRAFGSEKSTITFGSKESVNLFV